MKRHAPVALSIALGVLGGALFQWLDLPLPWVIGAMTINFIAALSGLPIAHNLTLREIMIGSIGMMLGSAFSPQILAQLGQWAGAALAMILFVIGMIALLSAFYRRFSDFDPVTCFFSATPGGLGSMAVIGEGFGGDPRMIPLVHAVRIVVVVFAIPAYLTFVEGLELPSRSVVGGEDAIVASTPDLAILIALTGLGYLSAKKLKIPAANIIGPMLLCAVAYLSGMVEGQPPGALVIAAQVVIGSSIGARFVGLPMRQLVKPIGLAVASALMMLAGAALGSVLLEPLLSISRPALLLALAPGGLAEMSLIAYSLDIDTAFVATMHVVRIVSIVLLAPFAFRLLRRFEDGA